MVLNVLVIEDNPGDVLLIKEYLGVIHSSSEYKMDHADTLSQAVHKIETGAFDVVLLDLFLPDSQGFVTCMTLLDKFPELIIIVLTGMDDEQLGEWTAKMGADDYLSKNNLNRQVLSRSIRYALERRKLKEEVVALQKKDSICSQKVAYAERQCGLATWEYHPPEGWVYVTTNFADILEIEKGTLQTRFEDFCLNFQDHMLLKEYILNTLKHQKSFSQIFTAVEPGNKTFRVSGTSIAGNNRDFVFGVIAKLPVD